MSRHTRQMPENTAQTRHPGESESGASFPEDYDVPGMHGASRPLVATRAIWSELPHGVHNPIVSSPLG